MFAECTKNGIFVQAWHYHARNRIQTLYRALRADKDETPTYFSSMATKKFNKHKIFISTTSWADFFTTGDTLTKSMYLRYGGSRVLKTSRVFEDSSFQGCLHRVDW